MQAQPTEHVVVSCRTATDVTADMKSAFEVAQSSGRRVVLEAEREGASCILSEGLFIFSGLRLAGQGRPVLKLFRTGNAFYGNKLSINFTIEGMTIDATDAPRAGIISLRGSAVGQIENVRLINPGDGIKLLDGTHNISIRNLVSSGSRLHGVTIKDSYGNTVDGAQLDGQAGFGVILEGASYNNHLDRLSTRRSGLELVGMTYQTHNNTLSNSIASYTGDNCYSITGDHNRLTNLSGENCDGNGVAFYGSFNTLEGGQFKNNNQRFYARSAWNGGVAFLQGFGGVAQHNSVRDVVLDDDQPQPTQQVGVLTNRPEYKPWRQGIAVKSGTYMYSGLSLYVSRSSGVTGTHPLIGSGTVSDGAVEWQYVNSFLGTIQPDYNSADQVEVRRAAKSLREDRSQAQNNRGTR